MIGGCFKAAGLVLLELLCTVRQCGKAQISIKREMQERNHDPYFVDGQNAPSAAGDIDKS